MVLSTRPEGKKLVQRPGEVVARVRVDRLEQPQRNPHAQREKVQVTRVQHVQDGHSNGTEPESHGLHRVRILRRQTKRRRIPVVLLVNVLVEHAVVQETMHPVVPHVLEEEEQRNLPGNGFPRRKWHLRRNAQFFTQRVERPDGDRLDEKVRQHNALQAVPLLLRARDLCRLNLVSAEIRNLVDDEPGETPSKVHGFVQHEEHDPGGQHVIGHVRIPRCPVLLDRTQLRLQELYIVHRAEIGPITHEAAQSGICKNSRHSWDLRCV